MATYPSSTVVEQLPSGVYSLTLVLVFYYLTTVAVAGVSAYSVGSKRESERARESGSPGSYFAGGLRWGECLQVM